ncbi:MAG TPA: hypothetical protein VH637_00475 [Streptosporangiaceae bacterium]
MTACKRGQPRKVIAALITCVIVTGIGLMPVIAGSAGGTVATAVAMIQSNTDNPGGMGWEYPIDR